MFGPPLQNNKEFLTVRITKGRRPLGFSEIEELHYGSEKSPPLDRRAPAEVSALQVL
jgi:hypothetical protein